MSRLKLVKGDNSVGICMDCDNELDTFIDVYVDDSSTPSPFKSLKDAEDFADIMKKLLEAVHDFN